MVQYSHVCDHRRLRTPPARRPQGRPGGLRGRARAGDRRDLAERFDVSPDTIRRDLDALDADGVLIRTHGGAISPQAVPRPDTGVDVRLRIQTSAKDQIGALAAGLVRDGASLMINAGTTTLAVARHLSEHRDLTVATNSLRMPTEINPLAFRDLYVFGGVVRLSAQGTIGAVAFPTENGTDRDIRCDLALIGVGAVSADAGYSTSNLGEAAMMSAMMDRVHQGRRPRRLHQVRPPPVRADRRAGPGGLPGDRLRSAAGPGRRAGRRRRRGAAPGGRR